MKRLLRFLFQVALFGLLLSIAYLNFFRVPPHYVGILEQTDAETEPKVLPPGRHWNSTGFVPDRWKLTLFPENNLSRKINLKLPLRYAEYLQLSDQFYVNISFNVKYHVNRSNVLSLYSVTGRNPDNLGNYVEEKVRLLVEQKYYEIYTESRDIPRIKAEMTAWFTGFSQIPEESFSTAFTQAFIVKGKQLLVPDQTDISSLHVPDQGLYEQQLSALPALQKAKQDLVISKMTAELHQSEEEKALKVEIERAKKYAELIRSHPEVLSFLRIDRLSPQASVIYLPNTAFREETFGPQLPAVTKPPAPPSKQEEEAPAEEKTETEQKEESGSGNLFRSFFNR